MLRRLISHIHPRLAVVFHDLFMVVIAWGLAKFLRYQLVPPADQLGFASYEFPIVLAVQGLVFMWLGIYKGLWRFASLPDLWNITKVSVIGAAGIYLALFVYNRLDGVPRTVLVLYPLVLATLLSGPRLAYRYWKDTRLGIFTTHRRQRVVVIGAGSAGEGLIRDLRRADDYQVVGFIDDDASLRGTRIHGIPVLGATNQLPRLINNVAANMLLIARPSADITEMRRVVELCESSGVPFRTMPRLEDVVAGRAQRNELKEVAIEDILGRDTVELDWTAIRQSVSGKRVLVTGGGGSIGGELCRQLVRLGAAALTVVDVSEYNLYRIQRELLQVDPDVTFDGVLAHCSDVAAMESVFARTQPQLVFHAAAYKHVPLLQNQLREAFRNNVLVTRTVADIAVRHNVSRFVLISTDKAVNPTSVMGACKRIAEMYCQDMARHSETRFVTVRFGNVLDSVGSVVPLFREQIREGGPVTVTHPEMSRYFMTIPEACQLILQASALCGSSEIFALDMGEPVKIRELAEQMIRLAGQGASQHVGIVYTGLRPGEKLFEELFDPQENYAATQHSKIFQAASRNMPGDVLAARLDRAADAVADNDLPALREQVTALLPSIAWGEQPIERDNVIAIRKTNDEDIA